MTISRNKEDMERSGMGFPLLFLAGTKALQFLLWIKSN